MTSKSMRKIRPSQKPVALLARIFTPFLPELVSLMGHPLSPKAVSVGGLLTDAYALPATVRGKNVRDSLKTIFDKIEGLIELPASYKSSNTTLMIPEAGLGRITDIDRVKDEDKRMKAQNAAVVYEPILKNLSRITGHPIIMEVGGGTTRAPYPEEDPAIHILAGANPQGETSADYQRDAFGLPLDLESRWTYVRKPTRGRGTIVSDGKIAVAQIIHRTVYLLIPVTSNYYYPVSKMIFEKLIAEVGTCLRQIALGKTDPFEERTDKASIEKVLTFRFRMFNEDYETRIETIKAEIEHMRRQLTDKYILLQSFTASKHIMNREILTKIAERTPSDLRRLRKHPLVKRIYVCDEGVHVDTQPIIADFEGERYGLGTFTIRLGAQNDVSVWGRESTHPNNIPHPHIPKDGIPCFGTINEALALAGAESRLYDAVDLVLRWLKDGFTPQSAEKHITEWPKVENVS